MTNDQTMGLFITLFLITSSPILVAYDLVNSDYIWFYAIFNIILILIMSIWLYLIIKFNLI